MVNVRSVVCVLCLTVAVFCPTLARPQFSFLGGIGVQTPIGGVHLGVPTGLTVNVGRPATPLKSPATVKPVPQEQPIIESNASPDEALGTRLDEKSPSVATVTDAPNRTEEADLTNPEQNPCLNVDPASAPANGTSGDVEDGNTTELPCLGIGAGNRINPKQAALLSLVG